MAILNINDPKQVKSRLFEMMNKVNKISLNEDNNQQIENTRDRKQEISELYPAEAKNEPGTTNVYETTDMPSKTEDNAKDESNPYLIFSRRTQDPKNVTYLPATDDLRVKDPEVDSIQEIHTEELGDEDLKKGENNNDDFDMSYFKNV